MKGKRSLFLNALSRLQRYFACQQFSGFERRVSIWLILIIFAGFYLGIQSNARAQVTILYSFGGSGQPGEGIEPLGGLILATDGSLYGVTYSQIGDPGGMFPSGTVFRLDPTSGTVSNVKSFPE